MTRRTDRKPLHLNAFLMSVGHHEAAWRLPQSPAAGGTGVEHYKNLARIAERGLLDSLFLADSPVLMGDPGRRPAGKLEPTVLLTALAAVTSRIGLIATASTSYNEPYNLARRFASVDHVSGGRAGWNIVTTAGADAARNFGLDDTPLHRDRYLRAAEFVDVATKLWDSWADDAVIADKELGVHAGPDRVRRIEHRGTYFRVDGPLNVERSPQGYPLLVQAGSSHDGKDFAARYAEAVFTAQQTLDEGIAFYKDVKQRALGFGRDPEGIKILPGIVPVIGDTEAEARELDAELDRLIRPEYAKRQLADRLRLHPDELDLDRELPLDIPTEDEIEGAKSRYTLVVELARREHLTVRQLIGRLGGGRGHRTFAGTAEQVADTIEHWYEQGAADGFNIMPAVLPSGLELFVDRVVPILQQRGLFRTEYTGSTLREHYGLPRPANRIFETVDTSAGHLGIALTEVR
ncbi:FMN-dependent oxidoreductase, nitrilotriacetate monooxygenase family [Streptomyces sp. DvalAA-14]|uniref:LLM class flavin-dependent oxidoreductase n=1 Tax=unclassified Streptomyces TaxID=2593676 RepID=UPI00081BB635|nr:MULTISPECIES: LLM class flavin-dependent oxidoreductase [unclassified Streptomyces]MYS23027.1 NtaA/DmoA family FMN-dependent monooxygenase [Streptomyces sp. SID4948]SCE26313.1 FMN-dependent oxidoreductase, nitrilotriacetate monooxygenase family [Streptomyces sp. DvalAA-14]